MSRPASRRLASYSKQPRSVGAIGVSCLPPFTLSTGILVPNRSFLLERVSKHGAELLRSPCRCSCTSGGSALSSIDGLFGRPADHAHMTVMVWLCPSVDETVITTVLLVSAVKFAALSVTVWLWVAVPLMS